MAVKNWQPTLLDENIALEPLKPTHFDILFQAASDPLIWEQHPENNRYQKDVFQEFFTKAILSEGAFIITDLQTNETIGSSRFYEYDEQLNQVCIGYTFLIRKHWGTPTNSAVKSLMINYAFKHVDRIIFHVGANNFRSQKALEKIGAKLSTELSTIDEGKLVFLIDKP